MSLNDINFPGIFKLLKDAADKYPLAKYAILIFVLGLVGGFYYGIFGSLQKVGIVAIGGFILIVAIVIFHKASENKHFSTFSMVITIIIALLVLLVALLFLVTFTKEKLEYFNTSTSNVTGPDNSTQHNEHSSIKSSYLGKISSFRIKGNKVTVILNFTNTTSSPISIKRQYLFQTLLSSSGERQKYYYHKYQTSKIKAGHSKNFKYTFKFKNDFGGNLFDYTFWFYDKEGKQSMSFLDLNENNFHSK